MKFRILLAVATLLSCGPATLCASDARPYLNIQLGMSLEEVKNATGYEWRDAIENWDANPLQYLEYWDIDYRTYYCQPADGVHYGIAVGIGEDAVRSINYYFERSYTDKDELAFLAALNGIFGKPRAQGGDGGENTRYHCVWKGEKKTWLLYWGSMYELGEDNEYLGYHVSAWDDAWHQASNDMFRAKWKKWGYIKAGLGLLGIFAVLAALAGAMLFVLAKRKGVVKGRVKLKLSLWVVLMPIAIFMAICGGWYLVISGYELAMDLTSSMDIDPAPNLVSVLLQLCLFLLGLALVGLAIYRFRKTWLALPTKPAKKKPAKKKARKKARRKR